MKNRELQEILVNLPEDAPIMVETNTGYYSVDHVYEDCGGIVLINIDQNKE